MKLHFFFIMCLLSHFTFAQNNFTGIYSYSYPVNRSMSDLKPGKEDGGASGELILAKMQGEQYAFWLTVNRGWPSYNNGFICGQINIMNGQARFLQKSDYADGYCILKFTVKAGLIEIISEGSEHCGFGHAVYADGKFRLTKKILNNKYLFASWEGMGEVKKISSEKAILYKDSTLLQPTGQYFIKNDQVYTSEVSAKGIRIHYMAKGPKYIYGWISQSDLQKP